MVLNLEFGFYFKPQSPNIEFLGGFANVLKQNSYRYAGLYDLELGSPIEEEQEVKALEAIANSPHGAITYNFKFDQEEGRAGGFIFYRGLPYVSAPYFSVIHWAQRYYWEEKPSRLNQFISFAKQVYRYLEADIGFIDSEASISIGHDIGPPRFNTKVGGVKGVEQLGWLNFLGREIATHIGRRKILKAPAERIEELFDGGFLIGFDETPWSYNPKKARKLYNHLFKSE